jgi:hypothetical protein
MLDFTLVRNKTLTLNQLAANLTVDDLRRLTNEMIDAQLRLIAEAGDADVVFVPGDPAAKDEAAATPEEVHMPWTLGHVIVHTTASSEEAAFIAAELARGVSYHGRSRYEVHWTTVTAAAQCRARLEESRRIRLASLDLWPDPPHLDNTYQLEFMPEPRNAVSRFVAGLRHDDDHLAQISEILRQARAAR